MPDIAIRTLHILVLLMLIKTLSPKIQYSSPYLCTLRLNSLLCLCNELVEHIAFVPRRLGFRSHCINTYTMLAHISYT